MATGDRIYLADKETLDSVDSKLDQLMTMINTLSAEITALKNTSNVKSVQLKEVTLTGGVSATINHNSVDLNKSIILLDSSSADNDTAFNSKSGARIFNRTATSFQVISFASECRVYCQIIEFN